MNRKSVDVFVADIWETKMRLLVAALVCIAVLYAVDVIWFNGVFFAAAAGMMSQIVGRFR
jgi:hypothetical protein